MFTFYQVLFYSSSNNETTKIDPIHSYGYIWTIILYTLRALSFLPLPLCVFHLFGLVFYNVFPEKVNLKSSALTAPFICVRVVTRGDYPELVQRNVSRNIQTCLDCGLDRFVVEVVTDKEINLPNNPRLREVIVPDSYRTKTGARYKSRALQYALEEDVNLLSGDDWIVHLDEETLLTQNSVCGIINFVSDGKYNIGQGLITYANEEIINWITTLADSFRVGADLGAVRYSFKYFHKALFIFKVDSFIFFLS
jgi:beta-1,4-mannosyltransferase